MLFSLSFKYVKARFALNTSMFDKASFKISILKAKKAPKLSNKLTEYTF